MSVRAVKSSECALMIDVQEEAEEHGLVLVTDGNEMKFTYPHMIEPGWTRFAVKVGEVPLSVVGLRFAGSGRRAPSAITSVPHRFSSEFEDAMVKASDVLPGIEQDIASIAKAREKTMATDDGPKQKPRIDELVTFAELHKKLQYVFEKPGALVWAYKRHRKEYFEAGAVYEIAGRLLAHPPTFEAVTLEIGSRPRKRRSKLKENR